MGGLLFSTEEQNMYCKRISGCQGQAMSASEDLTPSGRRIHAAHDSFSLASLRLVNSSIVKGSQYFTARISPGFM